MSTIFNEKVSSTEIKDLKKIIFLKQTELLEMQDFYAIPNNDNHSLLNYTEEINKLENKLEMKIKHYRNNKQLKKDLDLLNY